MVVVRGINVFPVMVAGVINQYPELSGNYRIRLASPPPHDVLPVEVELARAGAAPGDIGERIEGDIKRHIGVTARVEVMDADTLPRTEGKSKHLIREYQNEPVRNG